MEALLEAIPKLIRIAKGEPRVIYDEVKGREKVLYVYSRDQLEAMHLLQSLAKVGVLPENYQPEIVFPAKKEPKGLDLLLPLLPIRTDFSSVTVQKPDGTLFTARVDKNVDFINPDIDDE